MPLISLPYHLFRAVLHKTTNSLFFTGPNTIFLIKTSELFDPYCLMKRNRPVNYILLICFTGLLGCFSSCTKNLTSKYLVYTNDFENGRADSILSLYSINGLRIDMRTEDFNGSKVLGRFNNNTFLVYLSSLPTHNAIQIEFDLNIHDKWDGNFLGATGKPDIWQMTADNTPVLITTFSNTNNQQAYPNYYGVAASSPAKANSLNQNLDGVCSLKGVAGGSSMYRIVKTVAHTGSNFGFTCNDALQPFNSLCIKSWSIDNMTVTAIKY